MKVKIQMTLEPNELTEEERANLTDPFVLESQYGSSVKASCKQNKQGNYVVTIQYDSRRD